MFVQHVANRKQTIDCDIDSRKHGRYTGNSSCGLCNANNNSNCSCDSLVTVLALLDQRRAGDEDVSE